MPLILPYNGIYPEISDQAFIAENAVIIGNVKIGKGSSIWYNCLLRGDVEAITIGENTNIQDGTVIHVHRKNGPTVIGNGVTIGHMALLHACTLEDHCFVGMGAKVIDYAHVESYGMVAAGCLISPKKRVKAKELWAGVPGKFMRHMTDDEITYINTSEKNYMKLAAEYKRPGL